MGIGQGGHGRMIESRIAADSYHGLLHSEALKLSEPAGQSGSGAHGMKRLHLKKTGGSHSQRITADITQDKAAPAIHCQRSLNRPVSRSMRASGAEAVTSWRNKSGDRFMGAPAIIFRP